MKNSLRKNEREFLEMILRNAAKQDMTGATGSEISRDIIPDRWGLKKKVIKQELSGIAEDVNGMPLAISQREGVEVDCGHIVYSIEGVLGRCGYGHLLCIKEKLYTCPICRIRCCERETVIFTDGSSVCSRRKCRRKWLRFIEANPDYVKMLK